MYDALTEAGRKIFPELKKFNDFYLAGGTGLALQINHRISVDFDLFIQDKISKSVLKEVEKVFNGHKIEISVNNSDELTVFVDEVKITFLHYPFSIYSHFTEIDGLKVIKPSQIGLSKAYSIGRRGSYKDYIDLYFLLKSSNISLDEIVTKCPKIFGDGFSDRLFLEQLVYMNDVEEIDVTFIKNTILKEEIESYLAGEVRKFRNKILCL